MKDGLVDISDSELEDIWKNKTDSKYSKEFIESVHQEILKRNFNSADFEKWSEETPLPRDSPISRKSTVRIIVFTSLAVIVFLLLSYFNFIVFADVRLRSISPGQITLIGLSSFFIARFIWYLMERFFKIEPPFK